VIVKNDLARLGGGSPLFGEKGRYLGFGCD